MKKLIIASVIMAVALLAWSSFTSTHAQDPANEEKPTFYRLTPGVYVNGYPRFTITYPKDWVEVTPFPQEIFRAAAPGGTGDLFSVVVGRVFQPLDKVAEVVTRFFKLYSVKDVTVVTDKPSRLSNGTPAWEVELRGIMSGRPFNYSCLCVEHGDMWIIPQVSSQSGKIGEHLKAILYSLQYEPSKDEPVKVPPDIQEFLNGWRKACVSHDIAKVMTHYSDRYLNSGVRKGEIERQWKQNIGSVTFFEYNITDFISAGDRAYLAGFVIHNFGIRSTIETSIIKENDEPVTSIEIGITDFEAAGDRAYLAAFASSYWGKASLKGTSIIKESGEWKFYGNQRDVSR